MKEELSQFEKSSIYHYNFHSLFASGSARVQINLETDPVFHGRTKVLRLINYVLVLPRNLKHNLGQIYHLCEVGETEWDPTVCKEDPERPLF